MRMSILERSFSLFGHQRFGGGKWSGLPPRPLSDPSHILNPLNQKYMMDMMSREAITQRVTPVSHSCLLYTSV